MRSIVDPERFRAERDRMGDDVESFVKAIRADNHGRPVADVSGWLASAGESLISAARSVEPGVRVPWYGPDMTVASSITARIMETWAHTQDVVDAIGAVRLPTPRLQHVAFIGWRALPFSFMVSGRPVPAEPVRVELDGLVFGPADAANVVHGSPLDFCLLVTQRRHLADTRRVRRRAHRCRMADHRAGICGPARRRTTARPVPLTSPGPVNEPRAGVAQLLEVGVPRRPH